MVIRTLPDAVSTNVCSSLSNSAHEHLFVSRPGTLLMAITLSSGCNREPETASPRNGAGVGPTIRPMGPAEVFTGGGAPVVQIVVVLAVLAFVEWVFSTRRRNKAG
jgi:hypothetical protein